MEMTKSEWIESEYKKWEERFVIPFEDEFNVKALLGLRYQLIHTSEHHVRTTIDLIVALERLQKSIQLKEKYKPIDKVDREIMIVVENDGEVRRITSMFEDNLDNVISIDMKSGHADIKTSDSRFYVMKKNKENLRGRRCQVFINTSMDKSLFVKTIPAIK